MMHVAPMPERPPFKNGLTAFQVALSRRDMAGGRWKIADESGRRFEGFEDDISDSLRSQDVAANDSGSWGRG